MPRHQGRPGAPSNHGAPRTHLILAYRAARAPFSTRAARNLQPYNLTHDPVTTPGLSAAARTPALVKSAASGAMHRRAGASPRPACAHPGLRAVLTEGAASSCSPAGRRRLPREGLPMLPVPQVVTAPRTHMPPAGAPASGPCAAGRGGASPQRASAPPWRIASALCALMAPALLFIPWVSQLVPPHGTQGRTASKHKSTVGKGSGFRYSGVLWECNRPGRRNGRRHAPPQQVQ